MLLIVEDDPHYARVLVDLAHDQGFKVLVAHARRRRAGAGARSTSPTAVSLDVFLPDMLGWTVLSQLKQDPATRHIPVQIVTLDEDRQHGLARGAFSFVTKPTTTEGLEAALDAHQGLRRAAPQAAAGRRGQRRRAAEHRGAARPRRHRHRRPPTPATEALDALREQPFDCVVLDLRLPDMSGFEVLERIRDDADAGATCRSWSSPAGSCRPRRTRGCTRWRAASSSRAWSRPSGCSTRPRCSCTASSPTCRREKQRMLERLHRSDEDLVGQDGAGRRRRRAQHLRAEQRARAARHEGADRQHRAARRSRLLETTPDVAIVLMDIMMPEMDGYRRCR